MRGARLLAPLLALSLGACAWWMAGRPSWSQLDRLIFNHGVHQENDIECDTCHEGVEVATSSERSCLPAEEVCLDCHDREDNCSQCHTRVENHRPRERPYRIGFSHRQHLEQADMECQRCHGAVMEVGDTKPAHETCFGCHAHRKQYAEASCLGCHPAMRQMPLRAVAEFDHAGDWMARHGLQARSQGAACGQCHTETSCSDCHSRVAPSTTFRLYREETGTALLHRGDYISIHGIEARVDGATCLRCHQNPGYCESCHQQNGVSADGSASRIPHPPGWAVRGGRAFHGTDARIHIETCAGCHDQGAASGCVRCHKIGGIGGNPHPPGWSRSRGEIVDNDMCLICH